MVEVVPDEESSNGHPEFLVGPFNTPIPAVPGKISIERFNEHFMPGEPWFSG